VGQDYVSLTQRHFLLINMELHRDMSKSCQSR